MKKFILSAMACYALTAQAQLQPSKNFLYLYSDSIVYAQRIQLRPDYSGYWQLRADSRRVPVDQVKFLNNEEGFFANTRKLTFRGVSEFSERIIEGKINLYQERPYDPYAYDWHHRHSYNSPHPLSLSMYYNKGFGDLKKVRYKNLKEDMADHPESMEFLNTYRKNANLSKTLYVSAGVSAVASFTYFLIQGNRELNSVGKGGFGQSSIKSVNFAPAFILLGLSAGFAVGGFVFQTSGPRNIERAIESYNR